MKPIKPIYCVGINFNPNAPKQPIATNKPVPKYLPVIILILSLFELLCAKNMALTSKSSILVLTYVTIPVIIFPITLLFSPSKTKTKNFAFTAESLTLQFFPEMQYRVLQKSSLAYIQAAIPQFAFSK